jgi:hypothetical protein
MLASTPVATSMPSRSVRRLVLGAALLLALTVGEVPRTPAVHAQEAQPSLPPPGSVSPAPKAQAAPVKPPATKEVEGVKATIEIRTAENGKKTVTIEKPSAAKRGADATIEGTEDSPGPHGKRVTVGVFDNDREFDSFNDFVHNEPWLAAMVVGIVAVIFLSPVLAIALILGYRMRKARMLNETMLRLAEKGVVPPGEALGALVAGNPAAISASPSAAPLYEQARQIRQRAAWSDLRKGVIMGGIGLGLAMYSILDDGTPNALGLVLLFVGIGYLVLWWFEDRKIAPAGNASIPPPPAGPIGGASGSA